MTSWRSQLGLELSRADRIGFLVVDLSLARALYEGMPAARLLARARLGSDERDLAELRHHESAVSTFDGLVSTLTGDDRALRERIKKAVARHTRAAADEGPLDTDASVVAALVSAVAASEDADSSLGEVAGLEVPLAQAVSADFATRAGRFDSRLSQPTTKSRVPFFEACL